MNARYEAILAIRETVDFLAEYGLDAHNILVKGANRDGYDELSFESDGRRKDGENGQLLTTRRAWPEDFDYDAFTALARRAHPEFQEATK